MGQFSNHIARKLTDAERAAFLHIACLKAGSYTGKGLTETHFCAGDSVNMTLTITMKEIEEYTERQRAMVIENN